MQGAAPPTLCAARALHRGTCAFPRGDGASTEKCDAARALSLSTLQLACGRPCCKRSPPAERDARFAATAGMSSVGNCAADSWAPEMLPITVACGCTLGRFDVACPPVYPLSGGLLSKYPLYSSNNSIIIGKVACSDLSLKLFSSSYFAHQAPVRALRDPSTLFVGFRSSSFKPLLALGIPAS
jgi:hypothetical protein